MVATMYIIKLNIVMYTDGESLTVNEQPVLDAIAAHFEQHARAVPTGIRWHHRFELKDSSWQRSQAVSHILPRSLV